MAFGDYVEVYNGTTNTSKERSLPFIVLHPVGNATSTRVMWYITTKDYVRRSVWTKMVTNDMVIRTMNSYAEDANEKEEVVDEEPDDLPDLVDALDVDSDDEDDDDDDDSESRSRQSAAVAVGAKPKEGLTLATKVQESS